MMDGNLRVLFSRKLPQAHWQSIETGTTGQGVPDANYCCDRVEGWIEFKTVDHNKVTLRPAQIGWIERRMRQGGRCFIAVRRTHELFLFSGAHARTANLKLTPALVHSCGGPSKWDWDEIAKILFKIKDLN